MQAKFERSGSWLPFVGMGLIGAMIAFDASYGQGGAPSAEVDSTHAFGAANGEALPSEHAGAMGRAIEAMSDPSSGTASEAALTAAVDRELVAAGCLVFEHIARTTRLDVPSPLRIPDAAAGSFARCYQDYDREIAAIERERAPLLAAVVAQRLQSGDVERLARPDAIADEDEALSLIHI